MSHNPARRMRRATLPRSPAVTPPPQPPQVVGQVLLTLASDGNLQVQAKLPGGVLDVVAVLAQAQIAVLAEAKRPAGSPIEVAPAALVNRLTGTY